MGTRGPVPKRSNARAGHRTKAEQPDKVHARGRVRVPSASNDWHPRARDWYRALARSGQSRFYEESDWHQAAVLAEMLSSLLTASKPSSELFKAWLSGCHDLGVTEGARRRMRIEVERIPEEGKDESEVTILDEYRRLEAG